MIEMQRRPCTYHRRGVNAHIPEISGRGYLLGFGVDFEEFESGPGPYTVAIIEDADTGQLLSLVPTCVKMAKGDALND